MPPRAEHLRVRALRDLDKCIENEVWNGVDGDHPCKFDVQYWRFVNWAKEYWPQLDFSDNPPRFVESSVVENPFGMFPSCGGPPVLRRSSARLALRLKEYEAEKAQFEAESDFGQTESQSDEDSLDDEGEPKAQPSFREKVSK
jgi:hypothetical protein